MLSTRPRLGCLRALGAGPAVDCARMRDRPEPCFPFTAREMYKLTGINDHFASKKISQHFIRISHSLKPI
jgi:hypothetical protein